MYRIRSSIARTLGVSALAGALPLAGSAVAADWNGYTKMQEEVISAGDLLSARVSDGASPVGDVSDLVLDPAGHEVEYILYDTPYPFSFFGSRNGFATFEGSDFEVGSTLSLEVRFEGRPPADAPEDLKITEDEADNRLLSHVIGGWMRFDDAEMRKITDVLVDRDNGTITHFVVDMDAQSLFDVDRRAIPATMVTIAPDGDVRASTDIQGVDEIEQAFDPAYL